MVVITNNLLIKSIVSNFNFVCARFCLILIKTIIFRIRKHFRTSDWDTTCEKKLQVGYFAVVNLCDDWASFRRVVFSTSMVCRCVRHLKYVITQSLLSKTVIHLNQQLSYNESLNKSRSSFSTFWRFILFNLLCVINFIVKILGQFKTFINYNFVYIC